MPVNSSNHRTPRPGLGLVGSSIKARQSAAITVKKANDKRVAQHSALALRRAALGHMRAAARIEPETPSLSPATIAELLAMRDELVQKEVLLLRDLAAAKRAAHVDTSAGLQEFIEDLQMSHDALRDDKDGVQERIDSIGGRTPRISRN